jgi:hypothetical protein
VADEEDQVREQGGDRQYPQQDATWGDARACFNAGGVFAMVV